jgi:phosphoribosylaminoimidazolecarboxamide formyltransferase/IMP cyclohydrolase
MPNALISVSDKRGLVDFVKRLIDMGYQIYATDGTANFLGENGIGVKRLSEITGLKESKALKTLHPEVFNRIYNGFFDLVVVNLYEPSEIDIGGVALLRASAKAFDRVLVVCDVEDYDRVVEKLKVGVDESFRLEMAIKTFKYVVDYDLRVIEILKRSKRR